MTHGFHHRPGRVAVALLLFGGMILGAHAAPRSEAVDRVAAIVDSDIIYASQVRNELMLVTLLEQDNSSRPRTPPAALQRLIDRQLLLGAARERRMEVDESQLVRRTEDWMAIIAQRTGGRERFKAMLQELGIEEAELKQLILRREKDQRLAMKSVLPRVRINQDDVEAFAAKAREEGKAAEQCILAQIYLPIPASATDEQRAQIRELARTLHRELEQGASFSELARRYSQGPFQLDPVAIKDLNPKIADALEGLKNGDHTEPLFFEHAAQLLLLIRRVTPRDLLFQQRLETEREALAAELRQAAHIEILDEKLKPANEEQNTQNTSE